MMAITTSNSINVNPFLCARFIELPLERDEDAEFE
jgi:hypothetical protein